MPDEVVVAPRALVVNPVDALRESAAATIEAVLAGKEPPAPVADAPAAVVPPPVADPVVAALPDPVQADIAARVAELVRLESEQVRARQAIKSDADAARADAAAAKAELAALRAQLRESPMELLKDNQWDIEQLIRAEATQATPEAVRVARLESKLAERERADAARESAAQAQASEAVKADAVRTLKADIIPAGLATVADQFPLLKGWLETDAAVVDAVLDLMGREFNLSKGTRTLEPKEAVLELEKQMRARVKRLPGAMVTPPTSDAVVSKPAVKPSMTVTNKSTQHRGGTPAANPYDVHELRAAALAEVQAALSSKA